MVWDAAAATGDVGEYRRNSHIDFSDNVATIIADSAERARNIDVKRAQSAKERAEKHIQEAKAKHDEREVLEADIALRRAINRLNVRSKYGQ